MINRLILNENAYFYNINKTLSNNFIKRMFVEISRNKVGRYLENKINQNRTVNGKNVKYSTCIFKFKSKPSFLDDNGKEEEIKYAYLMIVEYSGMLIINKKNISGLNTLLKNYIEEVDYTTISRVFIEDESSFEKLSMMNMDVNNNAIRKRNLEAANIKNSFSAIYSSKYIINNLRINNSNNRISLALNTSKINRLGSKVKIDDYLIWCIEVVEKVKSFSEKETFLDNFSIPIKEDKIFEELIPTSVLFLVSEILSGVENNLVEEIYYEYKGKKRKIDINKISASINYFIELVSDTTTQSNFLLKEAPINDLFVRKNKYTYTINSKKLKKLYIKFNSETISLLDYINKKQAFIITFNKFDFVYSNKKLFKDSRLLGNIGNFLDVLEPFEELKSISTEKGTFSTTSSTFTSESLFYFVENTLATSVDYLFCDDLGNEFADFISIKDKKITFYHAKDGNSKLSASDFHIVVSQALKNIGNMNIDEKELINKKKERWEGEIKDTNIKLLRKGPSVIEGIEAFVNATVSPYGSSEIYLVLNFLSKKELEKELKKLQKGENCKNQVVQILWLLSSFITTCKEYGIIARITCLP